MSNHALDLHGLSKPDHRETETGNTARLSVGSLYGSWSTPLLEATTVPRSGINIDIIGGKKRPVSQDNTAAVSETGV